MLEELEYKMYQLIIYNISDKQKFIQSSHALQEFNNGMDFYPFIFYNEFEDNFRLKQDFSKVYVENFNKSNSDKLFLGFDKWKSIDKTIIGLCGGTSSDYDINNLGTINKHFIDLKDNNIPFSYFREPDLNNALTAICFLVDERVYNKEKYPDYNKDVFNKVIEHELSWSYIFKGKAYSIAYDVLHKEYYNTWVKQIGGESNVFLREFLKNKRLA